MSKATLEALTRAGTALSAVLGVCPEQHRDELAELVWRLGNLAAKIDPYQGEETDNDPGNPFGSATERGN